MTTAREAVDRLVAGAVDVLGDALVSVVVHGSLAWGCWGPASDIDVLVVVEDDAGLGGFHDMVVAVDSQAPGKGFELSVLTRTAALRSRHPIEFRYHYSRTALPGAGRGGHDPDLAGHLRVASVTGVCAYGLAPGRVFRRVSDEEFLASVGADVRDSLRPLADLTAGEVPVPVYAVLNAARTLAG
ncbi:nucleotidyltransferase domain-containing protein [Actinoplanes sp. NPDC051633]|uniref:nucleotidyltransferase domain-containing protein n=1 Tax=Actinoplanes sp. NPDC051633 TaxID=3155670 RepID=UPI003414DEFE